MKRKSKKGASQKNLQKQLSASLRTLRLNVGMKQETVAEFLHVSRSTYSYYETGGATPSVFTLYSLCQLYDVPMETFFAPVAGLCPDRPRVRERLEQNR
ncbi:helix-turn-helix transcriptional regulator [uncultured Neglectibacter sp.]|uniref:helix-turn-helix transcriptional regulator n=1 Tax=uncultured Neglectibacter sp. TaxID=1924108 RepID=UPI0034DF0DBA